MIGEDFAPMGMTLSRYLNGFGEFGFLLNGRV